MLSSFSPSDGFKVGIKSQHHVSLRKRLFVNVDADLFAAVVPQLWSTRLPPSTGKGPNGGRNGPSDLRPVHRFAFKIIDLTQGTIPSPVNLAVFKPNVMPGPPQAEPGADLPNCFMHKGINARRQFPTDRRGRTRLSAWSGDGQQAVRSQLPKLGRTGTQDRQIVPLLWGNPRLEQAGRLGMGTGEGSGSFRSDPGFGDPLGSRPRGPGAACCGRNP